MKAFTFRLDRVLRWRETQLRIGEGRVSSAAGRVAGVREALTSRSREALESAAQVALAPTGLSLGSYAGYIGRTEREIRELQEKGVQAQKSLSAELAALKDANRKVKLLENLRQTRQARWQGDFDRETGAFADEAFLGRLQSGGIQSKHRRARSSGG